jgi:hypothetical protein
MAHNTIGSRQPKSATTCKEDSINSAHEPARPEQVRFSRPWRSTSNVGNGNCRPVEEYNRAPGLSFEIGPMASPDRNRRELLAQNRLNALVRSH